MFWFTPRPIPYDQPPHPALDLARRFDVVFATLLQHILAAVAVLGRFANPAHARIHATHRRIAAILARVAEGTWRAPRLRAPRPKRRGGPPAPYLPRRRYWLGIAAGFQVRNCAGQLRTLLDAPETHAILAQAPPSARLALGRALRTAGRLLDVEIPSVLQAAGPPPPPRPKPVRPPPPPRPAPEPFRPLSPQIRAAVRAWKKKGE